MIVVVWSCTESAWETTSTTRLLQSRTAPRAEMPDTLAPIESSALRVERRLTRWLLSRAALRVETERSSHGGAYREQLWEKRLRGPHTLAPIESGSERRDWEVLHTFAPIESSSESREAPHTLAPTEQSSERKAPRAKTCPTYSYRSERCDTVRRDVATATKKHRWEPREPDSCMTCQLLTGEQLLSAVLYRHATTFG